MLELVSGEVDPMEMVVPPSPWRGEMFDRRKPISVLPEIGNQ